MAKAEREPSAEVSTVASCAATDCTHNESRSCTAGEIELRAREGGGAMCATYTPEKPKARP